MRNGLPRQPEGRAQIDVLGLIPLFVGHLGDQGVGADAGVVEQDIDGAKRRDGAIDNGPGRGIVRQIHP